ncbi:heparan-alpha-glucosaminide N-acetyltransferase-like [Penaeus japonicus]|uniref:heparan-alpha-glucosaminide N-acetyltransferase-like n=1 Tax=Penaeus japonicus TaxID=27405 RepID=UPI001C70DA71|nr:heparan-alpha-glucosaminide N-acetyltransferase-like [Penaeus japonicus]XP_042888386.1 heparan-alpha-glucosaminide N-acetyltransferase-like [Penaeus japonicus]XP_042888387.1 heparan-alpha-glucosaminide N-acetyltransferase-like [Penaeus japonicus]XP_042888388.1 heparan-alpha-glucosaminide N-acetyltransferase-like [Penaeus japonicus]XP_042888389.1 heparan-alpha-glucosaminide N-acetyltransferase-like [Penaeus japonicus]
MGSAFLEDPGVEEFLGFDLAALGVDEAFLRVTSDDGRTLSLYTLNGDCYGCPLQRRGENVTQEGTNMTLHTAHPWTFVISDATSDYLPDATGSICAVSSANLGEFGVYELALENSQCSFTTLKDPVFEYGAMVIALAVYVGLALLCAIATHIYKKGVQSLFKSGVTEATSQVVLQMGESTENAAPSPAKPAAKPRLKSLDTVRGISIVVMIFVNYGAGRYWFLEHATWNGLQVADLVFPWFLWIMGVCIPMGLRSALRRNTPKKKIFFRIVKRSLKLFLLGIILNSLGGWVYLDRYRIPGVLQRFAICYLVTAGVALVLSPKEPPQYQSNVGIALSDILQLLPQWVVHISIVIAHTLITFLLPVPGCPTGYIGPGGVALLQDEEPSPHCIGGAAGEVDRWLLSASHIYQNPTAKGVYSAGAFDPEGVLGSMTSIFQVFLGVQAGMVLQAHKSHTGRMVRWLLWSAALGAIGAGLCGASMNDGVLPLNKNLWSLSFVMVTSCFAFFLLAFCYLLVDVWGVWSGSPVYQAGMNSIFLYVGHNVAYNLFPWHYSIGHMNTHLEFLAETLWGTTLWVLIGLYLHHKGKFYTV